MEDNILHVNTFGAFSMSWNGVPVGASTKGKDSYFTKLMEVMLHQREKGVTRSQLEDMLFEDRELSDVHHTMRIVIYNARKLLRSAGLPDVDYFENRGGNFFWTDKIPVDEDCTRFTKLYDEAENEGDPDVRMRLYQEACQCYTGEFLPQQTRMIWVAQEDRRYREIFCKCVNNAAALMRMNHDYLQLESLGRYAMRIQPLSEWEPLTMEALIALGRQSEARNLYETTVNDYMEAMGFRPSFATVNLLDKLGGQITHSHALLDEIQERLTGLHVRPEGGYMSTYPVFQGIYQLIERMTERSGQSVYLMLCTIVNARGEVMEEGPTLERLSARLGDAILHSVRHSDSICRYGKGQYLVLLINTSREDCNIVQKRINFRFLADSKRSGIQYYVNSVVYTQDEFEQNQ